MRPATEDLFLLTLYERKNFISPSPVESVPYALIGSMFVDLFYYGKIRLIEQKRILLVDVSPLGYRYLDKIVETIQVSSKPKKLSYWITIFGNRYNHLQRYLLDSLVEKGFIAVIDEHYAWNMPGVEEPHRKVSVKFQRKQRLREIVLIGEPADEQSIITLALLNNFGLLDYVFTRDEIKSAGRRVKDLLMARASEKRFLEQIDEVSTAAAIASAMRDTV
ncbi:MAG: GPP34 family phosphoprotein [Anaerolineaceae bacterium]|nr:GPP34 family phosphoprotein [Anaerolineaceae bacterium]